MLLSVYSTNNLSMNIALKFALTFRVSENAVCKCTKFSEKNDNFKSRSALDAF